MRALISAVLIGSVRGVVVVGFGAAEVGVLMGGDSPGNEVVWCYRPTARSRASSSVSRWPSSGFRSGRVRRQPVSPKTIWSSLLVQVMLRACPVVGDRQRVQGVESGPVPVQGGFGGGRRRWRSPR